MEEKERIAWAITLVMKKHDLKEFTLAKKWGIDKATVRNYRLGKGNAQGQVLSSLVKDYGISGEWLLSWRGEPYPGAASEYPDICGPAGISIDQKNKVVTFIKEHLNPTEDDAREEFVFITQINGNISAGGGLVPDDSSDMRLAFRRDWFKKKGDPQNMSLVKVSGDSMKPTLVSGDLVLIDHSRTTIASQGGIYAISIDHEILIKRLQLLYSGGKIMIISDNKQYPAQDIEAEKVTINGKVIWYARELER